MAVVDDHTLFRQGLVSLLSTSPAVEVIGEVPLRASSTRVRGPGRALERRPALPARRRSEAKGLRPPAGGPHEVGDPSPATAAAMVAAAGFMVVMVAMPAVAAVVVVVLVPAARLTLHVSLRVGVERPLAP